MIFVSVASYRDPELIPTILGLVKNADNPNQLNIVVGWQYDDFESIEPIKHLVNVIDIPFIESKGVCWIRSIIQKQYNSEDYYFQIDSHCKFVKGWDTKLINWYKSLKNQSYNPIITTYLPAYIQNDCLQEIWGMKIDRFLNEGPLFFVPKKVNKKFQSPFKAMGFSGHFCFTEGRFCKNVPYDENLYFYGEESNLFIRSYTHGYDLFHPHEIIGWHNYKRTVRKCHWDDHFYYHNWNDLEKLSIQRYNDVLNNKVKTHKLGSKRTIKEFEKYTNVDIFKKLLL